MSYNGSVMVQSVSESDEVAPLCFLIENAIERRDLVLQLSVNNSQATMMVTSQFATEEGLSCAVLLPQIISKLRIREESARGLVP